MDEVQFEGTPFTVDDVLGRRMKMELNEVEARIADESKVAALFHEGLKVDRKTLYFERRWAQLRVESGQVFFNCSGRIESHRRLRSTFAAQGEALIDVAPVCGAGFATVTELLPCYYSRTKDECTKGTHHKKKETQTGMKNYPHDDSSC
jgi:hypothetical protein